MVLASSKNVNVVCTRHIFHMQTDLSAVMVRILSRKICSKIIDKSPTMARGKGISFERQVAYQKIAILRLLSWRSVEAVLNQHVYRTKHRNF